jgi:hypothetical protein
MSYRKNYTVQVINSLNGTDYTFDNLALSEAKSLAAEEARSKDNNDTVFIFTTRKSDGQVMYYNRDGFDCVGKSW